VALVLDSRTLPAADRPGALEAIFSANEVPQRVGFVAPPHQIRHRLELFRYGPNVHLLRNCGTGLVIDRSARHVRQGAPGQLAVFIQRSGIGCLTRGDSRTVFRPGDLGLMDTTRPYTWRSSKRIDHFVLLVDNPEVGLSVDQLRLAGERLASSPLYGIARAHFESLCAGATDLGPEAMAALGRATAQLLRATVIAAVDGPGSADCFDQTLFARMAAHADAHLHDPELTPGQIAAQHFISTRHLYNVWTREAGQSPGRWIMERRLERASALLAGRHRSVLPISWVARQCGFANMSHFSRRFREAFGATPRDWSITHHQG
jgi:AraC family transcriptional activator of tynA and feaB